MKLSDAMLTVVDRLKAPGVANLQAQPFDGRQEREDISARARAGGVWAHVAVLGTTMRGETAKLQHDVQFAAFLSFAYRPHPAAPPWSLMADLVGAVMSRLRSVNDWPDDMGTPTSIRSQNLYRLGDAQEGIARALVQWTQQVDVELDPDPVDFPPLELIVHEQHHINDDDTPAPAIVTNIEIEQ